MKRWLFLIFLASFPAISFLAGCGGGSHNNPPATSPGWTTTNALGSHWSNSISNSFSQTTALNAIVFYQDTLYARFMAGGANGEVAIGTDNGESWSSLISFPFTAGSHIYAMASEGDGGHLVAVGNQQIAWSNNRGASWVKAGAVPFHNIIYAIAFGAYGGQNIFVAAGHNGEIARSTDGGQTWGSLITNQSISHIRSLAYGDGVFIAGCNNGDILRSADGGATWQSVSSNPVGEGYIGSITCGAYDGVKVFVAKGGDRTIIRSVDQGLTWEKIDLSGVYGPYGHIMGVAYGDGVFVAVGDQIARSADSGRNWTLVDTSGTNIFTSGNYLLTAAFGNGTFVATGLDGMIARSNN